MVLGAMAVVLLLSQSRPASPPASCPGPELVPSLDGQTATHERPAWTEINRILRLPEAQRATQITHVYRDLFSALHPRSYPLANWSVRPGGSLDAYTSLFDQEISRPYEAMYAQQAALALIAAYARLAIPLIRADLKSPNLADQERGLFVARTLKEASAPGLYNDVKHVFVEGGACAAMALESLMGYAGSAWAEAAKAESRTRELVPIALARHRDDPEAYGFLLTELLSVGPAPAALLADLESGDETRRELAISALRSNGDPRLAPFVATMLGDPKWNIRLTGFRMGHAGVRRKDPAFTAVAPVLETLLRDPHWSVRREALITFAFAGNQASVPVLHELLTKWAAGDPFLSDADFHQLATLADAIGRQRFGFGDSRARVPARRDPKNPAAVEKFARWATAR